MNYHRLSGILFNDEGFRARPYKDSLGIWTIGIGCTSIAGEKVHQFTPNMTLEQARYHFHAHIFQSILDAEQLFPEIDELPAKKAEVLVMMTYQMGMTRLAGFVNFFKALGERNFTRAALEMRNSKWYSQTHNRAERLAKIMEAP